MGQQFMRVEEVAEILDVSTSYAYKVIGISKRVLDEAKKSLGVISIKEGCQWYWQLPEEKESGDL